MIFSFLSIKNWVTRVLNLVFSPQLAHFFKGQFVYRDFIINLFSFSILDT